MNRINHIVLSDEILQDRFSYMYQVQEANASEAQELKVDLCGISPAMKEEGYLALRAICEATFLPVLCKAPYKRLEDVKKVLYAGAAAAVFPGSPEEDAVYKEAAKRFGEDRLAYSADLPETGWEKRSDLAFSDFRTDSAGLIPVVAQDAVNDQVLMVAYMNEEAFARTVRTRRMTYYSRSRKGLWVKGETSGHFQYVSSLYIDCDGDTLLAKVYQIGAACHTGNRSCFYAPLYEEKRRRENPYQVLQDVYSTIEDRKENPKEGSYTTYLFRQGIDKILKKLGEENAETIIAAKNPEPEEIIYEISDYIYHLMVLMAVKGIRWEDITEELARRH